MSKKKKTFFFGAVDGQNELIEEKKVGGEERSNSGVDVVQLFSFSPFEIEYYITCVFLSLFIV
jgi:hypothetical protein